MISLILHTVTRRGSWEVGDLLQIKELKRGLNGRHYWGADYFEFSNPNGFIHINPKSVLNITKTLEITESQEFKGGQVG